MQNELRCDGNKLHGVIGPGWVEFKCNSVFCGSKPGVVVFHRFYFDKLGDSPETRRFKDPGRKT
jgi:hypothetical protein